MTIASCYLCPWEIDILGGQESADRARDRHVVLRHGQTTPETTSGVAPAPSTRDSADWRTQALDAIAQLAATGREFTVYEVAELGVPEPPNPQTDWGLLTRDARHLGLIDPVKNEDGSPKAVESKRPATKGSLVKVWRGSGRRTA